MGISGKLGQWIYSFLTNRKQAVLVNGVTGSFVEVESGVPQGSVLGPLLFLVLISDIDQEVAASYISSFADDTRAAKVYHYCRRCRSSTNWHAGHIQVVTRKNSNIKENTCYKTPSGDPIKVVEHAKDLGVIMSSTGTFKQHVGNVISTSSQLCSWVLRTFRTRQKLPMMTLWKSLIRPKLEYCCQLWCPTQTGDIQRLEQVQRSFIQKITGVKHLSYWKQLKELSMYSLERRRERYSIIYIWRIMEGQVPNFSQADHAGIQAVWHQRRGRNCIVPIVSLRCPKHVQTIRYASLGVWGPRLFNILPANIRNITGVSVSSFKHSLDKYLASVPDEPQIRGYTAMRRAESNSLMHMARFAAAQQNQLEEPVNQMEVPVNQSEEPISQFEDLVGPVGGVSQYDCHWRRPPMAT